MSNKPKTAAELMADLLKRVKEIDKKTPEQFELLRLDDVLRSGKLSEPDRQAAVKELLLYTKAVRAAFRAEDAMQKVKDLNIGKQRKRTHQLIELGGLVVLAGLEDVDKGAILGALLAFTDIPAKTAEYKKRGDALLNKRQVELDAAKAQRKAEKETAKIKAAEKKAAAISA